MTRSEREAGERKSEEGALEAEGQSFGHWLRAQREVREITLREIAESSKISLRYLQAFEEDRFEVLPSSVFAKGFLRQYARFVGLDPEEVVNFYLSARQEEGEAEEESSAPVRRARSRGTSWLPLFVIGAALLLVALLYLFSRWNQERDNAQVAPAPVPSSLRPAPVPAPTPVAAVVQEEQGRPLKVTVDFTGECWVDYREDGKAGLSSVKVESDSLLLEADEEVELTLGDASVAVVEVNGKPLPLDASPGEKRTLTIDLSTAAELSTDEVATP